MKKQYKLSDLLIDRNYQDEFTYDQRALIFNKYGNSTSILFFTPAFHLANFILSHCDFTIDQRYGFGHGKNMLDLKMMEKALEKPEIDKYQPFRYVETVSQEYLKITHTAYRTVGVSLWLNKETNKFRIAIECKSSRVMIPKINLYELIEEWCDDILLKQIK